jgi:hypothetical protein
MTPAEGAQRLVFHSQPEEGSFLNMLRPYRTLRRDVLADVLDALRACALEVTADTLPRDLVSALWAISHLGRSWGLDPGGMLRRNHLISAADQETLGAFLERFDYAVLTLLEKGTVHEAFSGLGGSY